MSDAHKPKRIAVAGNPNVGKTSLFNALTGLRRKVGNYPGITVDLVEGELQGAAKPITLIDLPGTYSLTARSEDERQAFQALTGKVGELDAVLVVLDATNLARNLYLLLQILELGLPCAVALNMVDLARDAGMAVDADELSEALGLPVVATVARDGDGVDGVVKALDGLALDQAPRVVPVENDLLRDLEARFEGADAAAQARMAVTSSFGELGEQGQDPADMGSPAARKAAAQAVIEARYAEVDAILERVSGLGDREKAPAMERSERIDKVVTHPVWGTVIFLAVMGLVFQLIFAWADPLVGLIEGGVGWLQGAAQALPEGTLRDLLTEGVIAGVGNVVVFLPQIVILFLCIGLLEDLGYMARGAFIVDRVMSRVGLSGNSFVPLLSGYACAVPAIMTTRTIASFKDRLVTILMIPFTSCSARLPIYALLIAALFDADEKVLGPLSRGGLILLGTYLLATVSALGMGFLYKRTILKSPTPPLVLELPPYRLPRMSSVLAQTWDRVKAFLRDAGTIILAATIVLWGALTFPRVDEAELEAGETAIEYTVGGKMGKAMEPALEPMGQDWRVGVGIIGSFAAREVFVSTLGIVYGIEGADEDDAPLREKMQNAKDPETGEPRYTKASGWALMIFFVYAAQCMSTLAVVKRETKSWKWPAFMFVTMSIIAYLAAVLVYQLATAFGS